MTLNDSDGSCLGYLPLVNVSDSQQQKPNEKRFVHIGELWVIYIWVCAFQIFPWCPVSEPKFITPKHIFSRPQHRRHFNRCRLILHPMRKDRLYHLRGCLWVFGAIFQMRSHALSGPLRMLDWHTKPQTVKIWLVNSTASVYYKANYPGDDLYADLYNRTSISNRTGIMFFHNLVLICIYSRQAWCIQYYINKHNLKLTSIR